MSPLPPPRSRLRAVFTSRAFWAIVASAALAGALIFAVQTLGGPEALHERYGWAATFALVGVQSIVAFWPVPIGEMIAFANSLVHGFWLGTALAWCGWMLTAFLQYQLAHRLARDLDFAGAIERMPGILRRFPVDHPAFLILGRLIPFPGPQFVNCAAGVFRVPLWRHLWCAAIGVLPGSMFIAGAATGLELR